MKRSRWLALAVLLLLVTALAAGCGQGASNAPAETTDSQQQDQQSDTGAESESASSEPVEIEFWTSWPKDGAQGQVLQSLLDEFNSSQDEVVVTHVYMGDERDEKIAAALASQEPPDIAWISGAGDQYYEADQLVSMDRVLNGEVLDPNDFINGTLENQQYLGEDISIPFENSNLAVCYNKGMLEEQGIDPPPAEVGAWTWSDFTEMAKAFSDPENNDYGWDPRLGRAMLLAMFWSAGGDQFSDDLKTNLICSDDQQRETMAYVLTRLQNMVREEQITAPDVGDQGFASGDMALEVTGPWALPGYRETSPDLEIGIASLPADDETGDAISYWYQKALALFKTDAEHEEATLQFIEWFYQPEIHARWSAEAGYLPITKSATEHEVWQNFAAENEYTQVFMDQAPIMKRRPIGIPVGELGAMVDTVILGEGNPQEAIDTYCLDAQSLLDEFWSRQD